MKLLKLWFGLVAILAAILLPTILGCILGFIDVLHKATAVAIFLPIQFIWIPIPFVIGRKFSMRIDCFTREIEEMFKG